MTILHPDWQATPEDAPVAPPVAIVKPAPSKSTHIPIGVLAASRLPAAVIGILVCVSGGLYAIGGWDMLQSQLPSIPTPSSPTAQLIQEKKPQTVTVDLTPQGPVPSGISVTAGQTIKWTNNDTIPHILESKTLRDDKGKELYSFSLFPGTSTEFIVGKESGAVNDYTSATKPSLKGTVIVSGTTPMALVPPASPAVLPSVTPPTEDISGQIIENPDFVVEGNTEPSAPSVEIPTNPYTVATAPVATSTLNDSQAAAYPLMQPEAGPALWVVSILSIACFAWMTRRSFGMKR